MSETPLLDALIADGDNHVAAVLVAPEHECDEERFQAIKEILEELLATGQAVVRANSTPNPFLNWLIYIVLYEDAMKALAGQGKVIEVFVRGRDSIGLKIGPPPF